MKKHARYLALLLAVLMLFALCACGGGEEVAEETVNIGKITPKTEEADLTGTWISVREDYYMIEDGSETLLMSMSIKDTLEMEEDVVSMTINQDGTGSMNYGEEATPVTWTAADKGLTILGNAEELGTDRLDAEYRDDQLVIYMDVGDGEAVRMYFAREGSAAVAESEANSLFDEETVLSALTGDEPESVVLRVGESSDLVFTEDSFELPAEFTADRDGVYRFTTAGGMIPTLSYYNDAEHTDFVDTQMAFDEGEEVTLDLELSAGQTVYFLVSPWSFGDVGTITITAQYAEGAAPGTAAAEAEPTAPITAEEPAPAREAEAVSGMSWADATDYPGTVLVDLPEAKFEITSIEPDGFWGYTVNVHMENNAKYSLIFNLDKVTVNGWAIDPFWACDTAPQSTENSSFSFDTDDFDLCGITDPVEITFELSVYNSDNWDDDDLVREVYTIYPLGDGASYTQSAAPAAAGFEYTGDGYTFRIVDVDEEGFWGYTLLAYMENNTDLSLCFNWDDVVVNGASCDPWWSCTLPAGTRALSEISFSESDFEEQGIGEVESIRFELSVSDSEDWFADDLMCDTFTFTPGAAAEAPAAPAAATATSDSGEAGRYDIVKYSVGGFSVEGEALASAGMDGTYILLNGDGTGYLYLTNTGMDITYENGDLSSNGFTIWTYTIEGDTFILDMQGVMYYMQKQ